MARTLREVAGVLLCGALVVAGTACGGGGDGDDVTRAGPGGTVQRKEGEVTGMSAPAPADGTGDGEAGDARADGDAGDGADADADAGDGSGEGGGGAAERAAVAGTVVHYDGWVFELGELRLSPVEPGTGGGVEAGQMLLVDVLVENPGRADEAPVREDFTLERDGVAVPFTVPYDGEGSEPLPVVPSGSTGSGRLAFASLPADFELAGTDLVFGQGDVHQGRVPLGGEGTPVTLAPVEVAAPGSATAGELTLTITGGRVDYGDTITHYPVPADKAILTLTFDVTASAGLDGYDRNLGGADLRLQLPDGTSLATRQDGLSSPNEIVSRSASLQALQARFEVPADTSGRLHLVLVGQFASGCCDEVQGQAPFDLPTPA